MVSDCGESSGRKVPFPPEMQGRWVGESEPSFEVIVSGSEITWHGNRMDYQAKTITVHEDGPIEVEVEFANQTDSGDALNLIAWPKGDMHAFSDHLICRFVRPNS